MEIIAIKISYILSLPHSTSKKSTILTGGNQREFLKIVIRMLKGCFHNPWQVGRNSVFYKRLATRSLTMVEWVYGQHKLDLVWLLFFWNREDTRMGGRVDLGGMGANKIEVHRVKFPNNQ